MRIRCKPKSIEWKFMEVIEVSQPAFSSNLNIKRKMVKRWAIFDLDNTIYDQLLRRRFTRASMKKKVRTE